MLLRCSHVVTHVLRHSKRCFSIYDRRRVSSKEMVDAYHRIAGYDDVALLASMSNILPLSNNKEIFANTEINLNNIGVIGFDYDYTLASYTQHLQHFIYNQGAQYLITRSQYPTDISTLAYDPNFVIRGLCYDKETGSFMKLDSSNRIAIESVFMGRERLSRQQATALLGTHQVSDTYRKKNMVPILDLFALAESCLLLDLCHCLRQQGVRV